MNPNKTFKVTLLDNKYGDNIRSKTITWNELMDRVKDPPSYRKKGRDGIIAGECEWKDSIAQRRVDKWEYVYDGDGEIVIEDGKKKRECVSEYEVMKDWRGNPIKRAEPGSRKVINRQLLFFDCDSIEEPAVWLDNLYTLCEWWNWAFALYSSFSATAEKPKYRVIIPLDKPVTPDEYTRITRAIMHDLKEDNFDPCSDRPTQLMFLPVWPKRQDESGEWENGYYEYIIEDDGDPLNTDEFLKYLDAFSEEYANYKEVIRTKTGEPVERIINRSKPKKDDLDLYPEGDPRNKNNIIGDFCRAYSITEAIEEFELPYRYVRENLYIYTQSESNEPGAHIKNDDTLLYSYHGTDPANGKDKNAWDLVMIHKFDGDYIEMCKFARQILNKPHD